jgi:hypothetical protein
MLIFANAASFDPANKKDSAEAPELPAFCGPISFLRNWTGFATR